MKNMIYRYLRYGCSIDFPKIKQIEITNASFEDVKDELYRRVEESVLTLDRPDTSIFQLSGGFDSSVIVSYFNNIKTFCTGRPGSIDKGYAERVSDHFKTDHTWRGYGDLLSGVDFKKAVIEMNRINRWPRCFRNDFGLYSFLRYAKDHADCIVSGKGIEFQFIGYYTIFNNILEKAYSNGDYNVLKAKQYLDLMTHKCPSDVASLKVKRILELKTKDVPYSLDMVKWWPSTFTKKETINLMGYEAEEPKFNNVYEITNFITDWFGMEYVNNRIYDYFNHFDMKSHTPYINSSVIDFTKTIPVEMKKCLSHHKYIFYQAMAHRVPDFIVTRPKEGLNTPPQYYLENKANILLLVGVYLRLKNLKIFDYLDFDVVQKHLLNLNEDFENKFRVAWTLINLSVWLEEHNDSDS